jgi:accessory colonization factor AcfC
MKGIRHHAELVVAVAMQGTLDPTTVTPLYLREAAILVRPGNPAHIKGAEDLMKSVSGRDCCKRPNPSNLS